MDFRTFYKKNLGTIKYAFIVLNILIFLSAIRAFVNLQKIFQSTDEVVNATQATQQHTDYINNFLKPYLESDYAPYFLAHENNQIFPGEKIITIVQEGSESISGNNSLSGEMEGSSSSVTNPQERRRYRKEIFSKI